jgi:hypothetical protein
LIQGYNELVNNQDMYNEMLTKLWFYYIC